MLLDGETPSVVDRAGFRGLMRLLQPRYCMPTGDTFQKTIIPELIGQLRADFTMLQQELLQNRYCIFICDRYLFNIRTGRDSFKFNVSK